MGGLEKCGEKLPLILVLTTHVERAMTKKITAMKFIAAILVAFSVFIFLSTTLVTAMEIKCVGQTLGEQIIYRKAFDKGEKITLCQHAELSGNIEIGDAAKIEQFITDRTDTIKPSLLYTLHLISKGGNVYEAMKIGRLIRQRFLKTDAQLYPEWEGNKIKTPYCGAEGKPVCCASACALIYLGGVQWSVYDYLGLHRPQLEDLGEFEYSDAVEHTKKGIKAVKEYLEEMEVDERIFKEMMTAAPNSLAVLKIEPNQNISDGDDYRYPKTINDWLFAKCRRAGDRPRWDCMATEARKEAENRSYKASEPDPEDQKFEAMTIEELRAFLGKKDIDFHQKYAATERLERRILRLTRVGFH